MAVVKEREPFSIVSLFLFLFLFFLFYTITIGFCSSPWFDGFLDDEIALGEDLPRNWGLRFNYSFVTWFRLIFKITIKVIVVRSQNLWCDSVCLKSA